MWQLYIFMKWDNLIILFSAYSAVAREEVKPRLCSTTSWGSEGESGSSLICPQAYFSHKARLSLRHQMDSNINAVDATY